MTAGGMVIVGAEEAGARAAASLREQGYDGSIVLVGDEDHAPYERPPCVPETVAARIADKHRAAGVEILCSVAIEAIIGQGSRQTVLLTNGTILACDLIVAGIGAIPRTHLAAASGLAVDNGISVDACLQSNDPDIFAAGDCCSFPHQLYGGRRIRLEAWRNAQDQGAVAAANMLGAKTHYVAVPRFWSDQYDETLQVAGLFDPTCSTVERPLSGTAPIYFHLDASGRLIAASAIGANNVIAKEIRAAEILIGRCASPAVADLSNPSFRLGDLLKDASLRAAD